jgi:hypothetical protein
MENIREFLCPHLTYQKIKKRCKVIRQQVDRPVESDLVTQAPQIQKSICTVCQNDDDRNLIRDDVNGTLICTGPDGHGCGALISENRFYDYNQCRI